MHGAGTVHTDALKAVQKLQTGLSRQRNRLAGDPGQLDIQTRRLLRKFQKILPVVDEGLGDAGVFPLLPEEPVKGQTALGGLGGDVVFPQQRSQGPGGEEEVVGVFSHKQQGVELALVLVDDAEGQLAVLCGVDEDLMISLFVLF